MKHRFALRKSIAAVTFVAASIFAGQAPAAMFETDPSVLESPWSTTYTEWLKRINGFADGAFQSCLKTKRDLSPVPPSKLSGSVALDVSLDVAKCSVQKALVDAGLEKQSSGRQCGPLRTEARKAVKALKPKERKCIEVEVARFHFEAERIIAKIKEHAAKPAN